MKTENFSHHEAFLARDHELVRRAAATGAGLPGILCQIRKCRRDGRCVGPMQPSPHMALTILAQQLLGMSGRGAGRLPACIALQSRENYAIYKTWIERMSAAGSAVKLTAGFKRQMESRKWPDPAATYLLTSPPYHPTSGGKEKG